MKKLDLTGETYGRLHVLHEIYPRSRPRIWQCVCSCGKVVNINQPDLRSGNTRSCGCYKTEIHTKHGDSKTKLHDVWIQMNARCRDKKAYSHGARGVTVCQIWQKSYSAFKKWSLANGYKIGLTIDRKDNSGDYTPANCRWTTYITQGRNQRKSRNCSSQYVGVSWNKEREAWESYITVNKQFIKLGFFHSEIAAAQKRNNYIHENALIDFILAPVS